MILNLITQDTGPQPSDYYGTVYKGSFLLPLLIIGIIVAVVLWWFFRSADDSHANCSPYCPSEPPTESR